MAGGVGFWLERFETPNCGVVRSEASMRACEVEGGKPRGASAKPRGVRRRTPSATQGGLRPLI